MPEEDVDDSVAEPSGAHGTPPRGGSRRRLLAPLVLVCCLAGVAGVVVMEPDQATRQVSDVNPSGPKLPVHEIDARPTPHTSPRPASSQAAASAASPTATGARGPADETTTSSTEVGPATGRRMLAMRATVRTRAEQSAPGIEVLAAGSRVVVTGVVRHGWHQVVVDGRTGWVAGYALAPLPH